LSLSEAKIGSFRHTLLLSSAASFQDALQTFRSKRISQSTDNRHAQLGVRVRKEAVCLGSQLPVLGWAADGNGALFDRHKLLCLECIEVLPNRHGRQSQPVCQLRGRQRAFRFQQMNQHATGFSFFGFGLSIHGVYLNIFIYKVKRRRYRDFVKVSVYKVSGGRIHDKRFAAESIGRFESCDNRWHVGLGLALVREMRARGAETFVSADERVWNGSFTRTKGRMALSGDVSNKNDIHPIAIQIVGALGGLDVLVNNASDLGPVPLALLGDTPCEDLERALATNVLGPFRLTKALLGALASSAREGRGGVVLNVSSDAAINPYPRWGAYGASKAALHHLSRIWDAELEGEGIRFLSLDPGDMDTPLHALAVPDADASELKRPETAARELAEAIVTVLSARAGSRLARTKAVKEALYDSRQLAQSPSRGSEVVGG
jgi:NAD(P)-dependent dehydrogenase (short-subunit alcohol dehydrogenase family)